MQRPPASRNMADETAAVPRGAIPKKKVTKVLVLPNLAGLHSSDANQDPNWTKKLI